MDVHLAMDGRENAEQVALENKHPLGIPHKLGDGDTAQECVYGATLVECSHGRIVGESALFTTCRWCAAPAAQTGRAGVVRGPISEHNCRPDRLADPHKDVLIGDRQAVFLTIVALRDGLSVAGPDLAALTDAQRNLLVDTLRTMDRATPGERDDADDAADVGMDDLGRDGSPPATEEDGTAAHAQPERGEGVVEGR